MEPVYRRAPSEVWSRIAAFIPRHHLRTWLSVSAFHREIALSRIFRTIDLHFGDEDNLHRGMDVFDRVKLDSRFASKILTLRIHWSFEEGDMLDLMNRLSPLEEWYLDSILYRDFPRSIAVFRGFKRV
jgi:hypothetical protein